MKRRMRLRVETIIEDDGWAAVGLESLAEAAAQHTLARLGLTEADYEISLMGCDDTRIAVLNADFRGKPVPTNVLSWPADERGAEADGDTPAPPESDGFGDEIELGDIAIALGVCRTEADAAGLTLTDHTTHLLVHGILHLLGYDHVRDQDATLMEGLEVEILASMGIADPYST